MGTFEITADHISDGTLTSEAIEAIQNMEHVSIAVDIPSPLTKWPEALIRIKGSLNLTNSGITSLPEGLTVEGNLDLGNTGITSLPKSLTVEGNLDLGNNIGITSLPEGLTVKGNLDLSFTHIWSLPEDLTVKGNLDLGFCNQLIVTKKLVEYITEYETKEADIEEKIIDKHSRSIYWPEHLDDKDKRWEAMKDCLDVNVKYIEEMGQNASSSPSDPAESDKGKEREGSKGENVNSKPSWTAKVSRATGKEEREENSASNGGPSNSR